MGLPVTTPVYQTHSFCSDLNSGLKTHRARLRRYCFHLEPPNKVHRRQLKYRFFFIPGKIYNFCHFRFASYALKQPSNLLLSIMAKHLSMYPSHVSLLITLIKVYSVHALIIRLYPSLWHHLRQGIMQIIISQMVIDIVSFQASDPKISINYQTKPFLLERDCKDKIRVPNFPTGKVFSILDRFEEDKKKAKEKRERSALILILYEQSSTFTFSHLADAIRFL